MQATYRKGKTGSKHVGPLGRVFSCMCCGSGKPAKYTCGCGGQCDARGKHICRDDCVEIDEVSRLNTSTGKRTIEEEYAWPCCYNPDVVTEAERRERRERRERYFQEQYGISAPAPPTNSTTFPNEQAPPSPGGFGEWEYVSEEVGFSSMQESVESSSEGVNDDNLEAGEELCMVCDSSEDFASESEIEQGWATD